MYDKMPPELSAAVSTIIAGLIGSLIIVLQRNGLSWGQRLSTLLCGVASAAYLAPTVGTWIATQTDIINMHAAQSAAGFLLGIFSMTIVQVIIEKLPEFVDKHFLKRKV